MLPKADGKIAVLTVVQGRNYKTGRTDIRCATLWAKEYLKGYNNVECVLNTLLFFFCSFIKFEIIHEQSKASNTTTPVANCLKIVIVRCIFT